MSLLQGIFRLEIVKGFLDFAKGEELQQGDRRSSSFWTARMLSEEAWSHFFGGLWKGRWAFGGIGEKVWGEVGVG